MSWLDEIGNEEAWNGYHDGLCPVAIGENDPCVCHVRHILRMARVLRELANIIDEEGLSWKWRKVLSDDAKGLLILAEIQKVHDAQQAFEEERARLHFLMKHYGLARFTWPDGTTIFIK